MNMFDLHELVCEAHTCEMVVVVVSCVCVFDERGD